MDLPIENGGSFHSYVSLPEGKTMFFFVATCSGSSELTVDFDWRFRASNFDDLVAGHH